MKYLGSITDDKDLVTKEYVDNIKDMVADEYSGSSTYNVGDYCTYNGNLYKCITAITIPEVWNGSHWTQVQLGDDVSDIRSAFSSEDALVNHLHSLVNYGYNNSYYQAETPGGTWATAVGIDRHNEVIVLNRSTFPNGSTIIRISGNVDLKATNAQVDTWTTGVTLKTGHTYRVDVTLLSGTSVYDSTVGARVPSCSVYRTGEHTSVATTVFGATKTTSTFVAESEVAYNLALYISNGKYTLTNAKFLVTLTDLTESTEYYVDNTLNDLKNGMEINTDLIDASHGYLNFGYDTPMDIPMGDGSTWAKTLGVQRIRNRVILNKAVQSRTAIYVKLTGADCGVYASTQIASWTNGLTLTPGKRYVVRTTLIGGVSTRGDVSDFVPWVGAYTPGSDSSVSTGTRSGNELISEFIAEEGKTYNIAIYTPSQNIAETVYMNAELLITMEEATASGDTGEIPAYYTEHIADRAAAIRASGLNVTTSGARFLFITDYHVQNNARNSGALMRKICEMTGIRNVVFGGDSEQSENTPSAGYAAVIDMVQDFSSVAEISDMYYITGNHEMNDPTNTSPEKRIAPGVIGRLFFDQMRDVTWLGDEFNSFYHDDNVAKLRTYYIGCNGAAIINVPTREAVINSLFTVPEEYTVLLISHVGLTWDSGNQAEAIEWRAGNIIDACIAMNDGTSCTVYMAPDSGSPHTYDFTGKQRDFIGMISGHTHRDGCVVVEGRFPVISTATDAYGVASQVIPPDPPMTPGTIYEQCFDAVQIDMTGQLIYMTRIGSGADRTIKYGENAGPVT